jgi:hypothetical protein
MYINCKIFFISLCVGICLVYIFSSQPEVILKYPTPETENDLIYQDKNNVCYKYKSEEVRCDNTAKNIALQDNSDKDGKDGKDGKDKSLFDIVKSTFN